MRIYIKILFLFCCTLWLGSSYAQQAVTAAGGDAGGAGGSASFTIGQIDFVTATGTGGTGREGVQQPYTNQGASFANGSNQSALICENTTLPINTQLAVTDGIVGDTVVWAVATSPVHGTVIATYTTIATGGTLLPIGLSYTPLPFFVGIDSFKIRITAGIDTAYTTIHVTVNPIPVAGGIVGLDSVCAGTSIALADTGANIAGSWHSSSTGIATVAVGIVTGVSAGTVNILYITTNTCGADTATHTITVNPAPYSGTISGLNRVCPGSTLTLTDATTGGVWSSSNTNATVSGGVVTGITTGTDSIIYTITNSCGTAFAYKIITISGTPTAISGGTTLCQGSTLTLTDATTAGNWLSSNTAIATVGSVNGIVSGIAAGSVTITYSTGCGTPATTTISVSPLPDAGAIIGSDSLCIGSTLTLTDSVTGGVWFMTNANASIASGLVNGISAGLDTVKFSVTNGCGTAITSKTLHILSIPNTSVIIGPDSVCQSSSITLIDTLTGGTWSATNSNASIASGIVSGLIAGTDTIIYTVTNFCGTDSVAKLITINTIPVLATIMGLDTVCAGSTLTLTSSVAGGTWYTTNINATITGIGGVVTGISTGIDSVLYILTNSCGSTAAYQSIFVNSLPIAGVISGVDSVCIGASTTLIESASGGVWTSLNTNASALGAIITGIANGMDTVQYTVTNACGSNSAIYTIYINTTPAAGSITGLDSVCVGATITLSETVGGGTWSLSNTDASISGSIVTGVSHGWDSLFYTVSNACGSNHTYKNIYIKTLPVIGAIMGNDTVCVGATITFTDSVLGGLWTCSNTHATVSADSGIIVGVTTGIDIISFQVTNSCGNVSATKPVFVKPIPDVGLITGLTSVCLGDSITLTDSITGGTWSSSNVHAMVHGGIVIGVSGGTDTITYNVVSSCGAAAGAAIVTIDTVLRPIISGVTFACIGKTVTLSAYPVGGVWAVTNADATILGGLLTGVSAGWDTVSYTVSNTCGTVDTQNAILVHTAHECDSINIVKSVPDIAINIEVYPNPNSGTFTVALPENIELAGTNIVITDLLGKTITGKTITNNTTRFVDFDLKNIAAATYFVKVIIGEKTFRTKVVVW